MPKRKEGGLCLSLSDLRAAWTDTQGILRENLFQKDLFPTNKNMYPLKKRKDKYTGIYLDINRDNFLEWEACHKCRQKRTQLNRRKKK